MRISGTGPCLRPCSPLWEVMNHRKNQRKAHSKGQIKRKGYIYAERTCSPWAGRWYGTPAGPAPGDCPAGAGQRLRRRPDRGHRRPRGISGAARGGISSEEEKVCQRPGGERGAAHCRRSTHAGDPGRSAVRGPIRATPTGTPPDQNAGSCFRQGGWCQRWAV